MIMKKIMMCLFVLGLIAGCSLFNQETVYGSGNVITENRVVSNISAVRLEGIGDVQIAPGDAEALVINADDNLLSYITTTVRNNCLYIGVKHGYNLQPTQKIRYTVTVVKSMTALTVISDGDMTYNANADQPQLAINISGDGDITATAPDINTCANLTCTISGDGDITTENIRATTVETSIFGDGNIKVWAQDTLHAQISGDGNIGYYGNPTVTKTINGDGDINHLGMK
jgi:hypothetical protein